MLEEYPVALAIAVASGFLGALVSAAFSLHIAYKNIVLAERHKIIDYLTSKSKALEHIYYEFTQHYEGLTTTPDIQIRWQQVNDLYQYTLKRYKSIKHHLQDTPEYSELEKIQTEVDGVKRIVSSHVQDNELESIFSAIESGFEGGNERHVNNLSEFPIMFDKALSAALNETTTSLQNMVTNAKP